MTGWADLGTIPWFDMAHRLPAEDVMDIASRGSGHVKIVVPRLSRIANFDDLDPLAAEPDVTVEIVEAGRPLPADADLVVLPGTKSTIGDLTYLRAKGGTSTLPPMCVVAAMCWGFVADIRCLANGSTIPEGIEGHAGRHAGLGLLNVGTLMSTEKRVTQVTARDLASGTQVNAYEIHIGRTTGPDCDRAWLDLGLTTTGRPARTAVSWGAIYTGCSPLTHFAPPIWRGSGSRGGLGDFEGGVETALDALAAHIERHMDLDALLTLAQEIER